MKIVEERRGRRGAYNVTFGLLAAKCVGCYVTYSVDRVREERMIAVECGS